MREAFANQLAELETRLEQALQQAAGTLAKIGEALGDPSDEAALAIARDAHKLRGISRVTDSDLIVITARQAPVAGDLRLVLALVQLTHHGGLIANQFELISEQLAEIDPNVADRTNTAEKLSQMTALAGGQLRDALTAFVNRDLPLAHQIDGEDDAIDRLNRQVFEATLELDVAPDHRELAMRHVLIARSLERIGDNAVDIAEQAAFLVSAELHEFTDASRPHKRAEHDQDS